MTKLETSLGNYVFDLTLIVLEARYMNIQIFSELNDFLKSYTVFHSIAIASFRTCFEFLLSCQILALFLFLTKKTLTRLRRHFAFR